MHSFHSTKKNQLSSLWPVQSDPSAIHLHESYPAFTVFKGLLRMPSLSESGSVVSNSLQPYGLSQPIRPLCPWNSPGQNTGVGSLSLLQGVFSTQGLKPGLLHCRRILYQLSHNKFTSGFCPFLLPPRCCLCLVTKSCPTLATPWTVGPQAPLSIRFSRQGTGGGCYSLLQGIVLPQGSNPHLLCCRRTLYG